jgi:hypothetical protein
MGARPDLADADLGRVLGNVLVADHPEGDHAAGIVDRPQAGLDDPVQRRVEATLLLFFADDRVGAEPVLADRAAARSAEDARLQRRDPVVDVEIDPLRRPLGGVGVELAGVQLDRLGRELIGISGSPNGCTRIPARARSGSTSRPKISQMQISSECSGTSS